MRRLPPWLFRLCFGLALHLQHLKLKNQNSAGCDELPALAITICELGREVELPLVALAHELHRLSPALYHL